MSDQPASPPTPLTAGALDEAAKEQRRPRIRPLAFAQGFAVALVFLLLGLLLWKIVHGSKGASLVAAVKRGDAPTAPAFTLPVIWGRDETWPPALRRALADNVVSLAELRGYPVVINFWASWCIPCKKEAPVLAASAKAHAGQVAFLGIDVQDLTWDARHFLRSLDVPYVSVRDKGPNTYTNYGLTGVPETYYLDRQGHIVAHSIGAVTRDELELELAKAAAPTSGR